MKRLLLGVFAFALLALALGFALPSDSHQVHQTAHASVIANTAQPDLVSATDTDVGSAVTAWSFKNATTNSAFYQTIPTTSSAIDPGGGTDASAFFGSTNDYATTASRAGPADLVAVLDSGSSMTITTTTTAITFGAIVLVLTALVLVFKNGGVRSRWPMMARGYAPIATNTVSKTATAQPRHNYALAIGAT